ncbi:MAG: methyl-accepting chemotaxis protein [Planctomycetota bacterium]
MSLKSKLVLLILLCGVVPMSATITFAHFTAQQTSDDLVAQSVASLEEESAQRLNGLLEGRAAHVHSYFQFIEEQVKSTAANPSVVAATEGFATSFSGIAEGNGLDEEQAAELRPALTSYHRANFGKAYEENTGDRTSIESIVQASDAETIVAQHFYLAANPHPLGEKQRLTRGDDVSAYGNLHAQYHNWFRRFQETFEYYDVFLIDTEGRVVYSVFKEADFGTSLTKGAWSSSGLGKLYQKLRQNDGNGATFTDYERYAPSYEAPASFIGAPITANNRRIGYLAFQMPISRINGIMASAAGLGETGDMFLVGSDGLMRSDSRQHPETNSVIAAFRDPDAADLGLPQVERASKHSESGIETREREDGSLEIIAFSPFELLGNTWCAIGRIDRDEVAASADEMLVKSAAASSSMLTWNIGLVVGAALLLASLASIFARAFLRPIKTTSDAMRDIAEGDADLTRRLDDSSKDEVGELAKWFNAFAIRIQKSITEIGEKTTSVTGSSNQLMNVAGELASGADRTRQESATVSSSAEEMNGNMNTVSNSSDSMAGTMRTVAAAVEEMTASIGEVATNAESAAKVADHAAELTRSSNSQISTLGSAANEIGRVIETIQDIAEQTNLLALNATIEAARAGEAGKGFSVVANEVKDLARQTAEATQDIRQRIERIQETTQGSVDAISEIDQVICKVNSASKSIAIAVGEQRTATQEIASNLSANTETFEVVNRNVAECVRTSQEIATAIQSVDQNTRQTAAAAENTELAGKELGTLAAELHSIVGQYKVHANAQ